MLFVFWYNLHLVVNHHCVCLNLFSNWASRSLSGTLSSALYSLTTIRNLTLTSNSLTAVLAGISAQSKYFVSFINCRIMSNNNLSTLDFAELTITNLMTL